MAVQAFDTVAERYDVDFTNHRLGRLLRDAVRRHLTGVFGAGDHILELGCGTGEDAVWLAENGVRVHATDASSRMLGVATEKLDRSEQKNIVTFEQVDLAAPMLQKELGPFDGAFSNFGALNTVRDRRPLAHTLSRTLKPGARAVFVVMGRWCPWEWLWYVPRGRVRTGFRRLSGSAVGKLNGDEALPVYYATAGQLREEFRPYFKHVRTVGIGVVLPPTFARGLVDRWPNFFERLVDIDFAVGRHFPGTILNDHFLIVLERTNAKIADTSEVAR